MCELTLVNYRFTQEHAVDQDMQQLQLLLLACMCYSSSSFSESRKLRLKVSFDKNENTPISQFFLPNGGHWNLGFIRSFTVLKILPNKNIATSRVREEKRKWRNYLGYMTQT